MPATPLLVAMRTDLAVVSLGNWPAIDDEPTVLFDALAEPDRALSPDAFEVFPSFLLVDRLLIASAYSRAADFNGFVGGHNLETSTTSYIEAVTPFSAATLDDTLFIEAGGLDEGEAGGGGWAT